MCTQGFINPLHGIPGDTLLRQSMGRWANRLGGVSRLSSNKLKSWKLTNISSFRIKIEFLDVQVARVDVVEFVGLLVPRQAVGDADLTL